jgi:hypothetical protein
MRSHSMIQVYLTNLLPESGRVKYKSGGDSTREHNTSDKEWANTDGGTNNDISNTLIYPCVARICMPRWCSPRRFLELKCSLSLSTVCLLMRFWRGHNVGHCTDTTELWSSWPCAAQEMAPAWASHYRSSSGAGSSPTEPCRPARCGRARGAWEHHPILDSWFSRGCWWRLKRLPPSDLVDVAANHGPDYRLEDHGLGYRSGDWEFGIVVWTYLAWTLSWRCAAARNIPETPDPWLGPAAGGVCPWAIVILAGVGRGMLGEEYGEWRRECGGWGPSRVPRRASLAGAGAQEDGGGRQNQVASQSPVRDAARQGWGAREGNSAVIQAAGSWPVVCGRRRGNDAEEGDVIERLGGRINKKKTFRVWWEEY